MAIMDLPHTMSVERLATTSGSHKEQYTPRPDVACFLQPELPADNAAAMGGQMTKSSRCYVDFNANVKVKDRVAINGKRYNVAGMREHGYGGWPHKVLSLEAI